MDDVGDEKVTVVKCKSCDKFFGWTEDDHKCRFCQTEYTIDKVEENTTTEQPKKKKLTVKSQKESFRMWKNDEE